MEEMQIYDFDNKDYVLVTKIDSYLYLSNEKDPRDMMIRKEDVNNPDLLLPLKDDEEFEHALLLLTRRQLESEES